MPENLPTGSGTDDSYLEERVRQEMQAALRCGDAEAAAAHVDLANRYLIKFNSSSKANGASERVPLKS